jgi:hypothetical protein
MKPSHTIFFAIPFDSATRQLYERVGKSLRHRYSTVNTITGNEQVGPSKLYSEISTFKAQNSDLTTQFVLAIQNADIVVADLTHNNPNVHLELGIALSENKNILRVVGRDVTEVGFDIRNLEVARYRSKKDLLKIITRYLDTFFTIKQLPISNEFPELYTNQATLDLKAASDRGFAFGPTASNSSLLRDGAVEARFNFVDTVSEDNWFGIFFRADAFYPTLASYLAYVRQNGSVEVAIYPGSGRAPEVFHIFSLDRPVSGEETMRIEFENNYLEIQIGGKRFSTEKLSFQKLGKIFYGAWQGHVKLIGAEVISRDTIDLRTVNML